MKSFALAVGLLGLEVAAFPADVMEQIARRQVPSTAAALKLSKARTNCGPLPCAPFDEKAQEVSISGANKFVAPGPDDIRGLCPGLNAAANHNYLNHNGISTIQNTVAGLQAAYGLDPPLSAALAAYAIIFDGDPVQGTWSIGGPPPSDPLTSGLLGGAQGLDYSHNVYEGDTSIGRNDAYLNHGDAYSLNVTRFASAYQVGQASGKDSYTLDLFAENFAGKVQESIDNNPYYFAAPFATTLVAPAAYNFVINLMSNHSAAQPSGYLNGAMFKEFFSVTGDYPNFKWVPGHEKIPTNWYRRPLSTPYGAEGLFGDLAIQFAAYPSSFRLGGNTNGVDTYEGVDLSDVTGGIYHSSDLLNLKTTNAACFYTQLVQAAVPDALATTLGELSAITNIINNSIKPLAGSASCPLINKYDQTLFNKFPGAKYRPTS